MNYTKIIIRPLLSEKANKLSSKYCIIIGEDEFKNNTCTIKNLNNNTQQNISIDNIVNFLKE